MKMSEDEANCFECGSEFQNGDKVFAYTRFFFCREKCLGYFVAKNVADEVEVEFEEIQFEEEE
jgi:hypothetical protein